MPRKALRNTPATVLTGKQRGVLGPLSRDCPRCGVPAGRKCVRRTGGKVRGEDIGGGYEVEMKGYHPERRKWSPPTDVDPDAEAIAVASLHLPYVNLTSEGMWAVDVCAAAMETTRDDAINRAMIYYARYVLGDMP